jgi:RNA polymerase sigma factor (sigma-70 family)
VSTDPAVHRRALARLHAAGAAAHGGILLDAATFAAHALDRANARASRDGRVPTRSALAEALRDAHGDDLYLAIACSLDVPGAWTRLLALHRERLLALATRTAGSPGAATDVVDALAGELVLPRRDGRRAIDVYDGSVRLSTWLSMICLRRLADRWRQRPMDLRPASSSGAPDPAVRAEREESARAVAAALGTAWQALPARHRLILLWKYRDGLAQRDIARLLDVGEPRVSRLVAAAMEPLRVAAKAAGLDHDALGDERLQHEIARRLATSEPRPERGVGREGAS